MYIATNTKTVPTAMFCNSEAILSCTHVENTEAHYIRDIILSNAFSYEKM